MYIYETLTYVNLYFFCIRCYMCIQMFLHKWHLHKTPSHVFINQLKAERFSACGGSLFHIFGPYILKLFLPIVTLTAFKFRFCWLRTGLSDDLTSKMFDIKHGFNWWRVLKVSRQSVLNLWMLICLNFLKVYCSC